MEKDIIIGFLSITIALFTLFFSILPKIRLCFIKKTHKNMRFFYERYRILNPSLDFDYKEITLQLKSQTLFFYGFPIWFMKFDGSEKNFNSFTENNLDVLELLSIWELYKMNKFWKKCNKKLEKIIKIITNFEYLCQINKNNFQHFNSRSSYMNNWESIIKRTSISIAPDFDSLKLMVMKQLPAQQYIENKLTFKEIYKIKHNNKLIKENIKSDSFSINIEFFNNPTNPTNPKTICFNLLFSKEKLKTIETFFHFNQYIEINEDEAQNLKRNLIWIKQAFKINKILEKFKELSPINKSKEKIEKIIEEVDQINL